MAQVWSEDFLIIQGRPLLLGRVKGLEPDSCYPVDWCSIHSSCSTCHTWGRVVTDRADGSSTMGCERPSMKQEREGIKGSVGGSVDRRSIMIYPYDSRV